ncbi:MULTISPECIES: hypothetical protein [Bacillus cereus group]|uniref:hypothetical protein n=1 Tax=Bacillus cereus group TaxID=86661 RepID=UPI0007755E63|nr:MULTISPECIES: hypothetical protein [Bacillus cereus group]KXO02288.1 hypothetical protein AYK81_06845 [Bacillus thuringiensis]TNP14102.1 hypothetical protein FHY73_24140 [Bacillus tropicus]TXR78265.1 hypothetical protein DN396_19470 [Bacillus sp. BF9-10]
MKKILRTIILGLFLSIALISMNKIAQATDNSKEPPEKIALKDYQNSKSTLLKDGKQLYQNHNFTSNSPLEISTFFFHVYEIQHQNIINNDSKKLSEYLLPTDEKLWFILNKNNPEGLIFTNEQEPIRMGGEKRSKDLYEIYKSIQTNVKQIKKIIYIEFEGQGLFVVSHENGEEVYASEGASFILGVPSAKKINPDEIILKMKERILLSQQ